VTEARSGEPVLVVGPERDGRIEVALPWQPSSLDARGYPGWIRAADVGHEVAEAPSLDTPHTGLPTGPGDSVELARELLGTPYVWGGLSDDGIDCSGLVHLVHRMVRVVVPRDARDQAATLTEVPIDDARRGDLYFFARPGRPVHHVGLVVEPGVMLHASDRDGGVVEASLGETGRAADLVAAGRPPGDLR
jgi:cell wall-associated NlpC family hydrolase